MRRVVSTAALAACTAVPNVQAQEAQAREAELPSIRVEAASDADSLHLDSRSSSASRLGLTLRETPASVELLDCEVVGWKRVLLTARRRVGRGRPGWSPRCA